MTGKEHTKKVAAEEVKKQTQSPFRCANCGETFVSKSEKQAHERSKHEQEQTKHAS